VAVLAMRHWRRLPLTTQTNRSKPPNTRSLLFCPLFMCVISFFSFRESTALPLDPVAQTRAQKGICLKMMLNCVPYRFFCSQLPWRESVRSRPPLKAPPAACHQMGLHGYNPVFENLGTHDTCYAISRVVDQLGPVPQNRKTFPATLTFFLISRLARSQKKYQPA